ncbi:MAG: hypothetical protein ACXQTP_07200 [Candidatus Methanofastidiosia archaeon]
MFKRSDEIAIAALLIALCAFFQLSPFKIVTHWGMKVDLVAIPVMIAFFLYGLRAALGVSVGMFVIISMVAGDSVLGASAKWIATAPMFIVPAIMSVKIRRKEIKKDAGIVVGAIISIFALIALIGIMYELVGATEHKIYSPFIVLISSVVFYSAFYLWSRNHESFGPPLYKNTKRVAVALILALAVRGITTTVINYYFTFPLFFGIPTEAAINWIPWYVMVAFNSLQGIIDVTVAWMLVFKTEAFSFIQKTYIHTQ